MDGLKTKKAAKVHENHAWNCRLLRGQLELLKSSIIEAIRRVFDQSDGRTLSTNQMADTVSQ